MHEVAERPLTEVDISRLAREIAREMRPLHHILTKAGITLDQYDRIQHSDMFQQRLTEEATIWSATTKSTLRERISTKAAIAIEELLDECVLMVKDKDIPGAARVQALQFMAKVGSLGEGMMAHDDGSGRVSINININGQRVSFEKEQVPIEGTATQVTDVTEVPIT